MKHAMAVGADRTQIFDRIDQVFFIEVRDLFEMVNLDVARTQRAIRLAKTKIADTTPIAMMLDASLPRSRTPVVGFGCDGPALAFCVELDFSRR